MRIEWNVARLDAFRKLYARLATAPEGGRELDVAVTAFFNHASYRRYLPINDDGPKDRWQFWSEDGQHFLGNERRFKVEPLTRSVDAGLAAVEALPAVWRVTGLHWIARGGGETEVEYGWGAFLTRRNDRISPICAAFVGASDGWTPRTAALALACVVCAARYAEETGQDVFVDRSKGTRGAA